MQYLNPYVYISAAHVVLNALPYTHHACLNMVGSQPIALTHLLDLVQAHNLTRLLHIPFRVVTPIDLSWCLRVNMFTDILLKSEADTLR